MNCTTSASFSNATNAAATSLSTPSDTNNQHIFFTEYPVTLRKIFSPDIKIERAIAEVEAEELASFTHFLLTTFHESGSAAHEFKFIYHDQLYTLTNCDGDILALTNKYGDGLTLFEQFNIKKLHSRIILLNLFRRLDPNTQTTFLPLFDLKNIGQIDAKSPIVSGDLDGSTARQIVMGIQAGIIQPNAEGIEILAEIMHAEANVLYAVNMLRKGYFDESTASIIVQIILQSDEEIPADVKSALRSDKAALEKLSVIKSAEQILFTGFQANEVIQELMEELKTHLTFDHGHAPYICLGDTAHDRLSNNKDIDRYIREMMKKYGAIFILGNHDVYFMKKNNGTIPNTDFDWLFGCFARNTATDQEWEEHQKVFDHGHYNELTNALLVHNGLEKIKTDNGKRYLPTAFGIYQLPEEDKKFDPRKFVEILNKQPRPRPDSLLQNDHDKNANKSRFDDFTNFRPTNKDTESAADALDINVVLGHSEEIDTTSYRVIRLNPRKDSFYTVAAARIGVSPSINNAAAGDRYERTLSAEYLHGGFKKRRLEKVCKQRINSI